MIAYLKSLGNVFSEMHKLNRVVIGGSRASMQDLKSVVGIRSRQQVELEQDRMAILTSDSVRVVKDRNGGGVGKVGWLQV